MPLLLALLACNPPLPNLKDAHRDYTDALPVFPGAEGFGTDTIAGRGGEIFVVDTLDEKGPGSLKAALEAEGPRTIVFEVGGTIWWSDNVDVYEPFLTIAGQTAPAPGITIAGAGMNVITHDVLIQHIAIRPGDKKDGPKGTVRDALQVLGSQNGEVEAYNVVVDHVSLTWGVDEVFSTWYRGVSDVTLSNSLIAEALDDSLHPEGPHSKGVLIGDHTRRFSMLGNLLAYNEDRNPIFKGDVSGLASHNYVYDPGRWPVSHFDNEGSGPSLMAVQDNVFERGKDTPKEHKTVLIHRSAKPGTKLFLDGNTSWDLPGKGVDYTSDQDAETVEVSKAPVSVTPLTVPSDVPGYALENAGSRPAARDAIDSRIVANVVAGTGKIIDSQKQVGGWIDDGVTRHELALPADPHADPDGDGYTELEHWLHQMASEVEPQK